MVLGQEALGTEVIWAMPIPGAVVDRMLVDGYLGLFCASIRVVCIANIWHRTYILGQIVTAYKVSW
jgi:hypothetical protein